MEIVYKKLNELIPYDKNPRDNDRAVQYVADSIKAYGFKVPLVIDSGGVIVTGHTRLKAAESLGMDKVPCIVADDLTEKQVKAFRIADNKVADFSLWDNKLLLDELEDLGDLFTGFDISEDFNTVLDETDNAVLMDNDDGVSYEVTFRSQDEAKIDKITEMWEGLDEKG